MGRGLHAPTSGHIDASALIDTSGAGRGSLCRPMAAAEIGEEDRVLDVPMGSGKLSANGCVGPSATRDCGWRRSLVRRLLAAAFARGIEVAVLVQFVMDGPVVAISTPLTESSANRVDVLQDLREGLPNLGRVCARVAVPACA